MVSPIAKFVISLSNSAVYFRCYKNPLYSLEMADISSQ